MKEITTLFEDESLVDFTHDNFKDLEKFKEFPSTEKIQKLMRKWPGKKIPKVKVFLGGNRKEFRIRIKKLISANKKYFENTLFLIVEYKKTKNGYSFYVIEAGLVQ